MEDQVTDPLASERAFCWLVARHTYEVMQELWPGHDDSCILSTRVALQACRYFGVPAEPLPVVAGFINAPAMAHLNAGHEEWIAQEVDGAWGVGIGLDKDGDRPGHWDGHLVVITPHYLIDTTCGVAARPHKNLPVPPFLVVRQPDHQPWADQYVWEIDDGVTATYKPTHNLRYKRAPDWSGDDRHKAAAGAVIRRLKALQRGARPGADRGTIVDDPVPNHPTIEAQEDHPA